MGLRVQLDRDYIESRAEKIPFSGCWLWVGTITAGYGKIFNSKRGTQLAHRISYEAFYGPIPQNLLVLHRCDVRCCVNPKHLYIGTYADNKADVLARNKTISSPRPWSRRFSVEEEEKIVALRAAGVPFRDIAKKFGCSLFLVWSICNGRNPNKAGDVVGVVL